MQNIKLNFYIENNFFHINEDSQYGVAIEL